MPDHAIGKEEAETPYMAIIENSTDCPKCGQEHWDALEAVLNAGDMDSDDDRWEVTCPCGTKMDLIWDDKDGQWNVGVIQYTDPNQMMLPC